MKITQFPFRGQRDYLHSSNVFDYLLTLDQKPTKIDFIFKKQTSNQCEILPDLSENNQDRLIASYKSQGMSKFLYEIDNPITTKVPCNEQDVVTKAKFSNNEGNVQLPLDDATFIQIIIAIYKSIVHKLPNLGNKKPMFARLMLDYVPTERLCKVKHHRAMGKSFFEGHIYLNNELIGKLFFGVQ